MSNGSVEQVATPAEMYEEPQTEFVADFRGGSNLRSVTATGGPDGVCSVRLGDFVLRARRGDTGASGERRVVIRPERVRIRPYGGTGDNLVPGMIERVVYLGSSEQLVV